MRVARGCVYNKADLCKGMQRLDDELKTLKYCGTCDDNGCNGSRSLESSVVATVLTTAVTCLFYYGLHWEPAAGLRYFTYPYCTYFLTKTYLMLLSYLLVFSFFFFYVIVLKFYIIGLFKCKWKRFRYFLYFFFFFMLYCLLYLFQRIRYHSYLMY